MGAVRVRCGVLEEGYIDIGFVMGIVVVQGARSPLGPPMVLLYRGHDDSGIPFRETTSGHDLETRLRDTTSKTKRRTMADIRPAGSIMRMRSLVGALEDLLERQDCLIASEAERIRDKIFLVRDDLEELEKEHITLEKGRAIKVMRALEHLQVMRVEMMKGEDHNRLELSKHAWEGIMVGAIIRYRIGKVMGGRSTEKTAGGNG